MKNLIDNPVFVPQPDASTCQSACVAMAIGLTTPEDVYAIRSDLEQRGVPGDPAVMGQYLIEKLGVDRYSYHSNASLNEMTKWLDDGELLITHGWFTRSGHVIAIDGYSEGWFHVLDPWSEFDFTRWDYLSNAIGYDGYYSAKGLYSACVHGDSVRGSDDFYHSESFVKSCWDVGNAWIHRIKPS